MFKRFHDHYRLLMLFADILKKEGTGAIDHDWVRSCYAGRPVDRNDNPIPWITFPMIDFLLPRIRSSFSIFEYGMGASTLWWAPRVRRVISVEHDQSWFSEIQKRVATYANVSVLFQTLTENGPYAKSVRETGERFDVIVIDGRDRVNCSRYAVDCLTPEGVIIWDNSDRADYRAGMDALIANGFKRIEFVGLAPGLYRKSETSVFYRTGNCLGI